MIDWVIWFFLTEGIGWAAMPLIFSSLPGLRDRGFSFARAGGLLLAGFGSWLFVSLGLGVNGVGPAIISLVLIIALGIWRLSQPGQPSFTGWLRDNKRHVIMVEILFIMTFALWAVFRAYNPDIRYTEKPMELAFLNGIRQSGSFPPHDPWLSGYAISYYYFGYIIMAMMANLGGTTTAVAYNLGNALLFSLTCLGAYGAVINLLPPRDDEPVARSSGVIALLGPLFVAVMGNLQGFLDFLFGNNLLPDRFWVWLDILDINDPSVVRVFPRDGWWWWRASRVINERDPSGLSSGLQPIEEFPQFSFLLGDMHPHVLALPFILLALGLAISLFNQQKPLDRGQLALYAIVFGGIAFLNTWDLPIILFVLAGAFILPLLTGQPDRADWLRSAAHFAIIFIGGLLLYLPWFTSFTSQAGGIIPNPFFATRFQQLFVIFGPFIVISFAFVLARLAARRFRADWLTAIGIAVSLLLILILIAFGGGMLALRGDTGLVTQMLNLAGLLERANVEGITPAIISEAQAVIIANRLAHPMTPLVMTLLIGLSLAAILPVTSETQRVANPDTFPLWLILTASLLVLGPEFVFLRDNFGARINTLFKFYYAAWWLFAIASAIGFTHLLSSPRRGIRLAIGSLSASLIVMGLFYPAFAIPSKAGESLFLSDRLTLNGISYIQREQPLEYLALLWIDQNLPPDAVILEASEGAYNYYGRVSSVTGRPTIIGWENHERQWRGDLYNQIAEGRSAIVNEIYATPSLSRALELIRQVGVEYVYIGPLERADFPVEILAKFDGAFPVVFSNDAVTIYRVDRALLELP